MTLLLNKIRHPQNPIELNAELYFELGRYCLISCLFLCTLVFIFRFIVLKDKDKGKAIPLQAWRGLYGSKRFFLQEFLDSRHMKVVNLSALSTGRLYSQRNIFIFYSTQFIYMSQFA